jgi:hypothetical protein
VKVFKVKGSNEPMPNLREPSGIKFQTPGDVVGPISSGLRWKPISEENRQ